jgi:uncharacterized membrane protein YraQ (UPF0718 family)
MSSERRQRQRAGWWFLAGVVLLYLALLPFQPEYVHTSFRRFLRMGRQLLPALGLVFLFLWLFNLFEELQQAAAQHTGKRSGLRGWLLAIAAGVLSHGPIWPWYPLLRELKQKGTRPALLAAFLYARSIKLPWLPVMAHYFGLGYMLVLTLLMLAFSPLNGWLVERLPGMADE